MKYYKFLTKEHKGSYSDFDYTDHLPGDQPGKWLPKLRHSELELCEYGYHACKRDDVIEWINAGMYEVEFAGRIKVGDNKVVGSQMRLVRKLDGWNDKTARLFAVWCAREALKLVDNPDPRSIAACDVAERYANGEATDQELASARAAAWNARAAARAAAWDAAEDAARAAAWVSARNAAWVAARGAACAAAWAAQTKKFWEMVEDV